MKTIILSFLIAANFATIPLAMAGHFFSDFNSGLPPHTKVNGDASIEPSGGVGGSGMLKLTATKNCWIGTFFIDPLDGDKPVAGFTARFKVLMGGGTGADGFGFHFGEFSDGRIGEHPFANELTVTFDTYQNVPDEIAPGIRVYFKGKQIDAQSVPGLRSEAFTDVFIQLKSDGSLNVSYGGEMIFMNLPTEATNMTGRFALGARVGQRADNHFIDNLDIETETIEPVPVAKTEAKENQTETGHAGPPPAILIVLGHAGVDVNTNSIELKLDGATVMPEISDENSGGIVVSYALKDASEARGEHAAKLQFDDKNSPPTKSEISYRFKVPVSAP